MTTADSATANAARAGKGGGWKEWRRPELPGVHQGLGPLYALFMFVLSVGSLLWPIMQGGVGYSTYSDSYYGEPNGLAILMLYAVAAPLAFFFFVFGLIIASVSYILREIRQAAYEAALRAGEVETRTR